MYAESRETLRRVKRNDGTLSAIWIGYGAPGQTIYGAPGRHFSLSGSFRSTDGSDYSLLGSTIAKSDHLTHLHVKLSSIPTGNKLLDGIKHNSSFQNLSIVSGPGHHQTASISSALPSRGNIMPTTVRTIGCKELLVAYSYHRSRKNRYLKRLNIEGTSMANGGDRAVASFLRLSTNLSEITLTQCNISDKQLKIMVKAMRGLCRLSQIDLSINQIGNSGCVALATLLEDPHSNVSTLDVRGNDIGNVGATTLFNSLSNNTKLRELYLGSNPINPNEMNSSLANLLCNKSTINDTYLSNHTLEKFSPQSTDFSQQHSQSFLLGLNKKRNKCHVAMIKILQFNFNINMEPFFEWNMEGEGERDLKALPYIIAWFNKAGEMAASEGLQCYRIERRKLFAIYQFAKVMPMLFVPASLIKKNEKKRKRDESEVKAGQVKQKVSYYHFKVATSIDDDGFALRLPRKDNLTLVDLREGIEEGIDENDLPFASFLFKLEAGSKISRKQENKWDVLDMVERGEGEKHNPYHVYITETQRTDANN